MSRDSYRIGRHGALIRINVRMAPARYWDMSPIWGAHPEKETVMRDKTRSAARHMPQISDLPIMENAQRYAMAGTRLQAHAFKAAMRYQIELLTFLKHRYEQDLKLADDLLASTELNDAFDVWSGFMERAATDYAAEAGKVASISSRIASSAAKEVRKEADASIEDLAAGTVA